MKSKFLNIIFSNSKIVNYIEGDVIDTLILSTTPDGNYQDLILNKQAIFNTLHSVAKEELKEWKTTCLEEFLTDKISEETEKKLDFNNVEVITFSISYDELTESMDKDEELYIRVKRYISNNKILKDKKISLGYVDINDSIKLDKLFKYFIDAKNVYVEIENQVDLISIPDLKKVMVKIDEIADNVNKKGYSPFEKIMYVYDLVRKREYKKEEKYEDAALSRDLNSVLFGDNIVCAGFSNICNALLNKIAIKSEFYKLISRKNVNRGHARNIVRLKDEKYDIDGIYFLDTTFDSKKGKSNNYLYSYKYFCKPYSFFKDHSAYEWISKELDECIYEYLELGVGYLNSLKLKKVSELIKKINNLSKFIDDKKLIGFPFPGISKEKVVEKINEYKRMFNNPISAEKFLLALEVVRKDEYLSEPDKYPYGINSFYNTLLNSDFNFKGYPTKEEKFYKEIFEKPLSYKDIDMKKRNLFHKIIDFSDDIGFGKESEAIRLAKVLTQLRNKKMK